MKSLRRYASNTTDRSTRPRVLLADDHVQFLESVSRELATDFEVVAKVTDGRQALSASQRFEPDVVVLDITMPELDGFKTLRELRRMGSRAKVVFLTMHGDDEYISAAIRNGANGYVLKTRTRSDLVTALRNALAGRMFVPTVSPLALAGGGGHIVMFYTDDDEFFDSAAPFLSTALSRGDTVALTLTEAQRMGIAQRMRWQGWDLAQLERQRRYLEFDAAEMLPRFVAGRSVDAAVLAELVGDLERTRLASSRGPNGRMTLCGTMASLLHRDGNSDAAMQLERTWDDLTRSLPLLTVCAYSMECFGSAPPPDLLTGICDHHSVVTHAAATACTRSPL